MARIEFEQLAASGYEAGTDPVLLDKIDDVLDALERDPGEAWLRMHRWLDPPLWGVTVRARGDDWLILWHLSDEDSERVIVDYIGSDVA